MNYKIDNKHNVVTLQTLPDRKAKQGNDIIGKKMVSCGE